VLEAKVLCWSNPKLQISNYKQISKINDQNSKLPCPFLDKGVSGVLEFEIWNLEIICYLLIGACYFSSLVLNFN